tara:strand:+ start:92 stop:235 length:144 start_codon:yes stop_codon:yes gene_type:complete
MASLSSLFSNEIFAKYGEGFSTTICFRASLEGPSALPYSLAIVGVFR